MDVMLVFRIMVIIMEAHAREHHHDIDIHINDLPQKQFLDEVR